MGPLVYFDLSDVQTVLSTLLLSCIYVGSLYIWRTKLHRDHPTTVKQRFVSVTVVSIFAPIYTWFLATQASADTQRQAFPLHRWLGIHTEGLLPALFLPLLLFVILFSGPLLLSFLEKELPHQHPCGFVEFMKLCFGDIHWWRDTVVAATTEEFVFRACLIPPFVSAFGTTSTIFLSPLFFGVAHVHHLYTQRHKRGKDLLQAVLVTVFQLAYTTLFGGLMAFVFLRTGHLLPAIFVHSFCNSMGFPRLDIAFTHPTHRVLLIVAFVCGLAGFISLLHPLTDPAIYKSIYYGEHHV
eukprot:Colp12_sorted_trinity150504_noHs@27770